MSKITVNEKKKKFINTTTVNFLPNLCIFGRIYGKDSPPGKPSLKPKSIKGMVGFVKEEKPELTIILFDTEGNKERQKLTYHKGVKCTSDVIENLSPNKMIQNIENVNGSSPFNLIYRQKIAHTTLKSFSRYNQIPENFHDSLSEEINRIKYYIDNFKEIIEGDINHDIFSEMDTDSQSFIEKPMEFTLANSQMESVPVKPEIPSSRNMCNSIIQERFNEIRVELNNNGKEHGEYKELKDDLWLNLNFYSISINALLLFLEENGLNSDSPINELQEKFDEEINKLDEVITKNMKTIFLHHRIMEKPLFSLFCLLYESGLDGNAPSIFHVNHHPVKNSSSIFDDKEPDLLGIEKNPLFDSSVEGQNISFKPFKDSKVIQNKCDMIVPMCELNGKKDIIPWATKAFKTDTVCFVNISPNYCGAEISFDPEKTLKTMRKNFTGEEEFFKNIVGVANPPVIREATIFENQPATAYPASGLVGKIYGNILNKPDASMSSSTSNPVKNEILDWMIRPSCASVLDNRNTIDNSNIIFIDTASNRRGDDIAYYYNSMCTLYSQNKHLFTSTLCKHFLQKIIVHRMIINNGCPNTNAAAKAVGDELHHIIGKLSSVEDESKPFLNAYVEKSYCNIKNGVPVQVHNIRVNYREAVETFEITIEPSNYISDQSDEPNK